MRHSAPLVLPRFGDAFANRGGCHDPTVSVHPRAWPALAPRWERAADAFLGKWLPDDPAPEFYCAHVRAEKLASAATGKEKRQQWVPATTQRDDEPWRSPYMEACVDALATVTKRSSRGLPLLLLTDTSSSHGSPSNQGSEHFKDWRARGERLLRKALPGAAAYCGVASESKPECAMVEAALCRRATEVLRFGSGTFSAFLVGDADTAPASTQFLSCPDIVAAAKAKA